MTQRTTRQREYHFSLGNSSKGPVGFCAVIVATSRRAAVARLRRLLPDAIEVPINDRRSRRHGNEYIEIYFNELAIRSADIDEVRPLA